MAVIVLPILGNTPQSYRARQGHLSNTWDGILQLKGNISMHTQVTLHIPARLFSSGSRHSLTRLEKESKSCWGESRRFFRQKTRTDRSSSLPITKLPPPTLPAKTHPNNTRSGPTSSRDPRGLRGTEAPKKVIVWSSPHLKMSIACWIGRSSLTKGPT